MKKIIISIMIVGFLIGCSKASPSNAQPSSSKYQVSEKVYYNGQIGEIILVVGRPFGKNQYDVKIRIDYTDPKGWIIYENVEEDYLHHFIPDSR